MWLESLKEGPDSISRKSGNDVTENEEIVIKSGFLIFGVLKLEVVYTIESSITEDFMLTHLIIIEW